MDDAAGDLTRKLSRPQASAAVADLGWRYVLGGYRTLARVPSLARAAEVSTRAVAACGEAAGQHLRLDVRPDLVALTDRKSVV